MMRQVHTIYTIHYGGNTVSKFSVDHLKIFLDCKFKY